MPTQRPSTKGFKRTASLLKDRIRRASESRGFAVSRLLTHWEDVVGPDTAEISRPVNVSYGRQGTGATLTILTTGANAPMLEMQKDVLRDRVNAVYGYNAISRIRLTQTAPTGFAEGRASFAYGPKASVERLPDPAAKAAAHEMAAPVADEGLRAALEALGENILTKSNR